ncbi:hypothetical protein LTR62_006017 [Meristemomyces frigidus]|uniref:Uncharacterized protein n=1 Tax=Meristemomyces frigidus TaxID=1508187 RepID=A0AAN7TQR9_9PEZI|nr:hypothetical protein LTR62_006017 [Meristemomyces frigidus]
MARQYTASQLLHLRSSPLVKRPDDLPAIEEWIEETQAMQQQAQNKQPSERRPRTAVTATAAEASPMGNFSTGLARPTLSSRTSTARGGDAVTPAPPMTVFTSSRTTARSGEFDKSASPLPDAAVSEDPDGHRNNRTFGDKQTNRKSMVTEATDGRTGENWRRMDDEKLDSGDRNGRYNNRREREQDGERRNGFGDKPDSRWQRDERRQTNGERSGGWREREREREKDRPDRGWGRGHADGGKDPEWMAESAPRPEEDTSRAKTAADFEKFMQEMKANNNRQSGEVANNELGEVLEPVPAPKEASVPKPVERLKLDGFANKPFGSRDSKSSSATPDGAQMSSKPSSAKPKTSRFTSLFNAPAPQPEMQEVPAPQPASSQNAAEEAANFARVMQMLGGTTMSQAARPNEPASPPPRTMSNGNKPKSKFTNFFETNPQSPERLQSPEGLQSALPFQSMPNGPSVDGRGLNDKPVSHYNGRLTEKQASESSSRSRALISAMSPEPVMTPSDILDQQRPPSSRVNDLFVDQPPSRGASTPDNSIQNLLAGRRPPPKQEQASKQSMSLLELLNTKGPKQVVQPQTRPVETFNPQNLWVNEPPKHMPPPHAPTPRMPPAGSIEEKLMRNHTVMETHGQLPPQYQGQPPVPDEARRMSQRLPPPGFMDSQNLSHFQQQPATHHIRNFTEPPRQFQQGPQMPQQQPNNTRRMSGHPGLSQLPLQQLQQQPPYPAEFLQSAHAAIPPPGFNPGMARHPPGINHIPSIFSTPQPPLGQSQRDSASQPSHQQPGYASAPSNHSLDPRLGPHVSQTSGPSGSLPPAFFGGPQGYGGPPPSALPMPQGFGGQQRMAYAEPIRGGGVGVDRRYEGYGAGQAGGR